MLLQDKVVLITGAGDGIGRATAMACHTDGASVAVADIRSEAAAETVAMITERGGRALAIQADIADEDSVAAMVAATTAEFGRLDCAINNAAGGGNFRTLTEVSAESWDHCHGITLKGTWLCMKYEIPAMLNSGAGAIVNIASLSGVRGEALMAAYSSAKGGVLALTRTAAAEYAQQGIRVNAINPGGIVTRALTNYFERVPEAREQTAAQHAMRRLGEPHEIADAACYLVSDRASFITGTSLDVDGGIMVNPHTL